MPLISQSPLSDVLSIYSCNDTDGSSSHMSATLKNTLYREYFKSWQLKSLVRQVTKVITIMADT